ncbi:MAG: hypothetical protein QOJ90_2727, partial [Actinomycetota bacterium]|nr:hypothetical protein [Actinomycetota bacterium]
MSIGRRARLDGSVPISVKDLPVATRPMIVTADLELLDELLRLCAAAGAEAQVAHDVE